MLMSCFFIKQQKVEQNDKYCVGSAKVKLEAVLYLLSKGEISTRRFFDYSLKTSRRHMRSRNKNRQGIVERLAILIGDFINDSVFYCACVIVRISDDFMTIVMKII